MLIIISKILVLLKKYTKLLKECDFVSEWRLTLLYIVNKPFTTFIKTECHVCFGRLDIFCNLLHYSNIWPGRPIMIRWILDEISKILLRSKSNQLKSNNPLSRLCSLYFFKNRSHCSRKKLISNLTQLFSEENKMIIFICSRLSF